MALVLFSSKTSLPLEHAFLMSFWEWKGRPWRESLNSAVLFRQSKD